MIRQCFFVDLRCMWTSSILPLDQILQVNFNGYEMGVWNQPTNSHVTHYERWIYVLSTIQISHLHHIEDWLKIFTSQWLNQDSNSWPSNQQSSWSYLVIQASLKESMSSHALCLGRPKFRPVLLVGPLTFLLLGTPQASQPSRRWSMTEK